MNMGEIKDHRKNAEGKWEFLVQWRNKEPSAGTWEDDAHVKHYRTEIISIRIELCGGLREETPAAPSQQQNTGNSKKKLKK